MQSNRLNFTAINQRTPPTSCSSAQPPSAVMPSEDIAPVRSAVLPAYLGLGCKQISSSLDQLPRTFRRAERKKVTTREDSCELVTPKSSQTPTQSTKAKNGDIPTSPPVSRSIIKRKRSSQTNEVLPFPITKPGVRLDGQSKRQILSTPQPKTDLVNDLVQFTVSDFRNQEDRIELAAMQYQTPQPSSKTFQNTHRHRASPHSMYGPWTAQFNTESQANRLSLYADQSSRTASKARHVTESVPDFQLGEESDELQATPQDPNFVKPIKYRQESRSNIIGVYGDLRNAVERDVEIDMYELNEDPFVSPRISDWQPQEEPTAFENGNLEDDLTDEVFMALLPKPCLLGKPSESTNNFFQTQNNGLALHADLGAGPDMSGDHADIDIDWDFDENEEADLIELSKSLTYVGTSVRKPGELPHTPMIEDLPLLQFSLPPCDIVEVITATPVSPKHSEFGLKPIVRPPFPARIRDRSPVTGLTSDTMLRVCFRVGEALNSGCEAVRRGHNIVIELYARVLSTERDVATGKQSFAFGDLFHNRPPFLNGVYEGWKDVDPWDYDSAVFLEQNSGMERLCRCIGRMKKKKDVWQLAILNIWEAAWEDVEHVKGIMCL